MAQSPKFRVYLAGPISGCNRVQRCRWRHEVKKVYGARMTFLDPVDNLLDPEASPYEFVEADLQSIMEADGLLVNMWQESIGTAMGVAHAHRHGRAVVVSDPNHLENKMLTFFADAVEEKPLQAAKALWNLLRAERSWHVVKSGERADQAFERKKIMDGVRAACREAKRDDILIPRLVLPRVIEQLRAGDRKVNKSVTTTEIARAVTGVLKALEGDPSHFDAVEGVLHAWRDRRNGSGRATGRISIHSHGDRLAAGHVPVSCGGKSHATIWGNKIERLQDIPSADARRIFRSLGSVSGITGITLGQFGHKGSRSRCQASVAVSKTPFVIEGKLFDNGPKGTMQSFQVRVQDDDAKQAVAEGIERVLCQEGTWAD